MQAKQALGLGLVCGLVVGALACVAALIWTGGRLTEAQADAYDLGVEDGFKKAQQERSLVHDKFNEMVLDDNERLTGVFDQVSEQIAPLAEREDIPEDARGTLRDALKKLGR